MVKFFRRMLIAWVLFVVFAIAGGGGLLRRLDDKTAMVSHDMIDLIATKADNLKADADSLIEKIRERISNKKATAENQP